MKLQVCAESAQLLRDVIEQGVQSRTGGAIRGLRVDVFGRQVIISGRAPTYYAKQLATHATLDAAENLSLRNEIEVF